jgi:hypothetical protein
MVASVQRAPQKNQDTPKTKSERKDTSSGSEGKKRYMDEASWLTFFI